MLIFVQVEMIDKEFMDKFTVTSKEFIIKHGITRQRAYELRNGAHKLLKSGKMWTMEPRLFEGEDFTFVRGRLFYRENIELPVARRGRKKKI